MSGRPRPRGTCGGWTGRRATGSLPRCSGSQRPSAAIASVSGPTSTACHQRSRPPAATGIGKTARYRASSMPTKATTTRTVARPAAVAPSRCALRDRASRRPSGWGGLGGWWRPSSHTTPETEPLTEWPAKPRIGLTGLLNLVALVEKRRTVCASRDAEGGVLCPRNQPSEFPPAHRPGTAQSLGATPPSEPSAPALAAEPAPRTPALSERPATEASDDAAVSGW